MMAGGAKTVAGSSASGVELAGDMPPRLGASSQAFFTITPKGVCAPNGVAGTGLAGGGVHGTQVELLQAMAGKGTTYGEGGAKGIASSPVGTWLASGTGKSGMPDSAGAIALQDAYPGLSSGDNHVLTDW